MKKERLAHKLVDKGNGIMLPIKLLNSYFCFSEMGWLHPHGAQSGVPGGSAEDEGAAGLTTRLLFS